MEIVIDTNAIISALIRDGAARKILMDSKFEFFAPSYTLSEVLKCKKEICLKSNLSNEEFHSLVEIFFKYIRIIPI